MDRHRASREDMSDETGTVVGFAAHGERAPAIGEVHARPHPVLSTPRVLLQLAFISEAGSTHDRAVLDDLSRRQGVAPPAPEARHLALPWGRGTLRWERHTEFSTYLWEGPPSPDEKSALNGLPFGKGFTAPGRVISGVRLDFVVGKEPLEDQVAGFDAASLCFSMVEGGLAAVATDFRQDGDGLTRILVIDRGLAPARAGALAQRLIEIETYRTLAMLGLPLAQSLSPRIRRIEERHAELTGEMRDGDRRNSEALLAELTGLAAELEADAAASLYRFGASRAYHGIVEERLDALGEAAVPGYETLAAFLRRRVAPAMRTCRSIEERQAALSEKLGRAAMLLRTWVDVEVERQNRDLLASMNRRARLQLRLQQTVEGLSVAAVSYYVVGLIGYLAYGLPDGWPVSRGTVMAAGVLPVVLVTWLFIRRIRRRHDDGEPNVR
ncbi:MAG: DUF3422 family protein [Rhizobiaceae bacterium]|nr:DUF3422 family protein [Rhizobiaceae bacterium]MCV0406125.1 DUF3422 family protein [Rhizobiaceae bacterium]